MEIFEQFVLGVAWLYWAMFQIIAGLGFLVSHLGFAGTALALCGVSIVAGIMNGKLK